MKSGITAALLLVSMTTCSYCQTRLKGHYLGESTDDFEIAEGIPDKMESCHSRADHIIAAETIRTMPEDRLIAVEAGLISSGQMTDPSRKKLLKIASHGGLHVLDLRTPAEVDECDAMDRAFRFQTVGNFAVTKNSHTTTFHFKDDAISEIDIGCDFNTFEAVAADFSQRAGVGPTIADTEEQNTFGARWTDHFAYWKNNELYAVLKQDNRPNAPRLTLRVYTLSELDRAKSELHGMQHPLD